MQLRYYKDLLPRRLLIVVAYILITAFVVGSFLPGSVKKTAGTAPYRPATRHVQPRHRLYHFTMVGAITLVLMLLARSRRSELNATALVVLLCLCIEWSQLLLHFSIQFEWWDVRDDLFGAFSMIGAIQLTNLFVRPSAQD